MLTLKGQPLPGYFAPSQPEDPSLILIHEYWGLNEHIKDVARRFSGEGFNVFAVDLFAGKVATDEAAAEESMKALDWKVGVPLVGQALEALRQLGSNPRTGVLGFCLGGAFSLACAAALPGLDACVPFYGIPPSLDATKIKARVLGHFAIHDRWCSPPRVAALEQQLSAANVAFDLHRYDAQHAFFNDSRPVYSPEHAKLAWNRSLQFLHTVLGQSSSP